jgi:hypothetical protein
LFNLDKVCAAESAKNKLLPAMVTKFCWRILYMLEKSKFYIYNIGKSSIALKSLKRKQENTEGAP